MKLIARTLAVLTVALLVVGATIAIVGTRSAAQAAPAGAEIRQRPAGANGAERPDRHGEGGASLFGAVEVGMNLIIIGVIVAAVSLVRRVALGRRPAGSAGRQQQVPDPTAS
jgi:hypothetical protein